MDILYLQNTNNGTFKEVLPELKAVGLELTKEGPSGNVFVLRLCANENRFNPSFLKGLLTALDVVERAEGPTALLTLGEGEFFSNGLDLKWLAKNEDRGDEFLRLFMGVLARFLSSSVPTVAAINGHAYGGGLLFALTHDYRLMATQRGFCCMPEIELGFPLTPGMTAIARAKLRKQTTRNLLLLSKRYTGAEALAEGIVDEAVQEQDALFPQALQVAARLSQKAGLNRAAVRALKQEVYARPFNMLTDGGLGQAHVRFGKDRSGGGASAAASDDHLRANL
ncbi:Enoyl-CoA delta isomerase 1, peroxisomal [Balamuthia mandrillaris]